MFRTAANRRSGKEAPRIAPQVSRQFTFVAKSTSIARTKTVSTARSARETDGDMGIVLNLVRTPSHRRNGRQRYSEWCPVSRTLGDEGQWDDTPRASESALGVRPAGITTPLRASAAGRYIVTTLLDCFMLSKMRRRCWARGTLRRCVGRNQVWDTGILALEARRTFRAAGCSQHGSLV